MEELLASLNGRLDAFLERSDASGVLADDALIEAAELLQAARQDSGGLSMRVFGAVAWLYWCRSLALPGGAGEEDRAMAVEFFEVIGRVDPEMVPSELRLEALPDDSPELLGAQAVAILHQTRETDEPAAIDEVIGLLRQATQAVPRDHTERASWLYYLSSTLRTRFAATDNVADLHAAVDAGQEAVATALADDPHRAAYQSVLGNALLVRFERLDTVSDLHAAVSALHSAVAAAADDPGRAGYLSNLGAALHARFQRLAIPDDLDGAITANKAAVDATLDADPRRAGRLSNLALGLRTRFEHEDDVADVDEAIALGRAAVDATPEGHPDHAGFLANLGVSLLFRYRRVGRLADLDTGIATADAAIDATPQNHPNRPGLLSNLGEMLRARFERLSYMADLDAAVAALEEAVAATPAGHANQAPRRSNLAIALRVRFEHRGARADIDVAVIEGKKAVVATPEDDPERAGYLSSLGLALLSRFEQFGDVADVNAAIACGLEAVTATPVGHPERAGRLSELAGALETRFRRTGDVDDLDAAVNAAREAVTTAPADHPRLSVFQHNLSSALHARHERDGELADLDAAVAAGRAAVVATSADNSERGRILSHLGVVLLDRFHRSKDVADLDAAIAAGRESVDVTPADFPDRALYLSMYGLTLHERFEVLGSLADLDAAIAAGGEAVDATPTDHPDRATYLSNLGSALRTRFKRLDQQADLDAAIAANQEAATLIPANHPYRARFLYTFGLGLRTRFDKMGNPADARSALETFRKATAVITAPTAVRMEAAKVHGELAASLGWWADAADGYAQAVELLPFLAWLGAGQRSREQLLTDWGGLAADGAACAVAAGQLDRAITMLEQGRGVLWSQLLETRSDLSTLHQAHPDLAARLDSLRAELDRPSLSNHDVDSRIAAARQWQALIDQVRALPGFQDFARPPEAAQLRCAAAGSIVVVNISRWRCDALVVADTGIEVKALTGLTQDATVDKVNSYLDALQQAQTIRHSSDVDLAISGTLEWLWDDIAEPVLDMLGHHQTPSGDQEWPRVWWCPTGPLTIVPLHAAGYHNRDGQSVLDRVVSSYTPTLRALSAARSRPESASPERLLLIALPDTPGAQSLPNVNREKVLLTSLFDEQHTVLAGSDATRTNILRELPSHTWAHASCHGDQNMAEPTAGGLVPYDWQTAGLVNVVDLTNTDHAGGEFVFLSACKSATGGISVLDESISLAAALHYTGWRHVIGTLWSVGDNSAADITDSTYSHLLHAGDFDPARAAEALHHALRDYRRRDNHRHQPSRWAPFSHTGP